VRVIDLTESHEPLFFCCLEDWSEEMKEAGPHKELWYRRMKEEGLRVKLAEDDRGEIGGMIQYIPIERSHVEGEDLYFIHCIWVHGHKKGRGDFRNRGMGKALLDAAEEDARQLGAKGMAAWGLSLPIWMKASWFRKRGYRPADKDSIARLMWKPFTEDASPPKWIKMKKKPETAPGKVTVASFINGWCSGQNIVHERAKRAAAEFGDRVVFQEYNTSDPAVLHEWGLVDALFIDGKAVRTGPPTPYAKIRKKIAGRIKRL